MGILSGYIKTLKGLLATHDACKFNFGGIPNLLKKVSPQFRMFLDSKLDSPTENATKKMWADSIVGGIRSKFPKNKLSQKVATGLGNWIGEKANSFMDRVKLLHQYHQGRITIDQYLDKRATQIQSTFVNVTNKLKHFAWFGRKLINSQLEELGIPEPDSKLGKVLEATGIRTVVKKIGKGVENVIKSEKTKEVIKAGILTVHKGVTSMSDAWRTVKERVVEPVLNTIANVAEKTVEAIPVIAKKTVEAVKEGWKTTKETAKKVLNWLRGK